MNREELYLLLCRFMQDIYLKHLMVNAKDHRVVVVESLLCPTHFRNTLARVLFNHLNVPYATFVPSHLLCLFTIGRQSALVVDVGCSETTILPVYEGIPVVTAWQSTSYAAEAVQNSVKTLLLERAVVKSSETGQDKPVGAMKVDEVIEASIEDIIARTCFVRPQSVVPRKMPPDVHYPLNSKFTLVMDGHTRDHAADVLFEDSGDDQPLPICILEALLKSPVDTRRELSENIIVVGGITALPGFKYRLKQELETLVKDKCQKYCSSLEALAFRFHEPPAHANTVAWLGGSIFGSSEVAVLERAVTRDTFRELAQLPDWTSCDPEQREQLRAVPTRKLLPAAPSSSLMKQTVVWKPLAR